MANERLSEGLFQTPAQVGVTPGAVPYNVMQPETTAAQLATDIAPQVKTETEAADHAEGMMFNLRNSPAARRQYIKPEVATAGKDETEAWAQAEDIGQDVGNSIGRTYDAAIRGVKLNELGLAGSRYRTYKRPEDAQRIVELQEQLDALGAPPDGGYVSWFAAAAEVLGQQYSMWTRQVAAERMATGAGLGAAIGMSGGPFAAISVPAGATAGFGAGAVIHMILNSFAVEGGLAYIDLRELGIEDHIATPLSVGVGVLNSGLEMAGALGILKPFSEAGKAIVRKSLRKAIMSEGTQKLLKDATLLYGKGIFLEVSTEVIQEMVNIASEAMGAAFSDNEIDTMNAAEIEERLVAVAEHTFKAMVLLAGPGAGAYVATNIQAAKQADRHQASLDEIKEIMDRSQLEIDDKSDMIADILQENDIKEVWIPADQLQQWIEASENPASLTNILGVSTELTQAVELGQDVRIKGGKFAKHIIASERYEFIRDHIRLSQYGMTPEEGREYLSSGVKSDMETLVLESEPVQDSAIVIPERQLGLRALFKTGEEAGMTPKQFEAYGAEIERAGNDRINYAEDLKLRQEQRENTKEWKAAKQAVDAEVREEYNNTQTYGAIHAIGRDRLNRAEVEAAAAEAGIELADLPTNNNRKIYTTTKGDEGISLEQHAYEHGYDDAVSFIEDIVTALPFEEAVAQRVQQRMETEHGTLLSEMNRLIEARKAVQSQATINILAQELNALRLATSQKKLKPSVLRTAARERMREYGITDVTPAQYERAAGKAAKAAGKAFRQGDLILAEREKFKQLINTEMARQAYSVRDTTKRKVKTMRKLIKEKGTRSIGHQTVDDIRQILSNVGLGEKRPKPIKQVAHVKDGVNPTKLSDTIKDGEPIYWRDMKLGDFEELYDLVTEIAHKGRQANKLLDAKEKRDMARIRQIVVGSINRNLKTPARKLQDEQNRFNATREYLKDAVGFIYNADTILRELDGFEDLGPMYSNFKGRYDRAMSVGYRDDQVGFLKRQREEVKKISAIYDKHFTLREQKKFGKSFRIKGVKKKISRHTVLSVLLNHGNAQNLKALQESGIYTPDELKRIREYASKREWQFAQDIWDYFGTFWNEVHEAEIRRKNVRPKQVRAKAIKTKHGTFSGGYYPIRWKGQESVFFSDKDMTIIADKIKYGSFVTSHTERGHTLMRTEGVGNPLDLNLYVINSHMDQVIYDLEVGDAVNDAYKVLYDNDVKQTFINKGARHKWEQLDLWLRDVIKGQTGASGGFEKGLHWARTGVTVSKLGWNVGVAALQPLGLLHTAVQVGKIDTLNGLVRFMGSPLAWSRFAKESSGFMQERSNTYQQDINDASKALAKSWLQTKLPGRSGEFIQGSFFFFIRTMQSFVDNVTWIAAYKQGLNKWDGDHDKAVLHGDRMVARSQASGLLGERTPLERGTISKDTSQKEIVKIWTNFLSYFLAKANIGVEQYKRTTMNPKTWINFVVNMGLIFTVEAYLAALIRNEAPDDEDDPLHIKFAAKQTVFTAIGSVPMISGMSAEMQGFRGGSAVGTVGREFAQMFNQIGQGELDEGLYGNALDAIGIWKKLPTGQVKKTYRAYELFAKDKDVHWSEFLLGPEYGK